MGKWEQSPPPAAPFGTSSDVSVHFSEQESFQGKPGCKSAQQLMGPFLPGPAKLQPRLIRRLSFKCFLTPLKMPRAKERVSRGFSPQELPLPLPHADAAIAWFAVPC